MAPVRISLFALAFFALVSVLPAQDIPAGYKKQELTPIGGEVLMPESWFYRGGLTETGFTYIFSKEKRDNGSYETGFRIQGFARVKEVTGEGPRAFCMTSFDNFKSRARKILRQCEEEDSGLFRKTCLEALEPNPNNPKDDFHVIYSFFWSEKMDLAVVTVFGSTESQWAEADKTYQVMKVFKLMDPSKLADLQKSATAPAGKNAP